MQSKQEIQETARVIISFTNSYTYNKERKQIEKSESDTTSSLTDIASALQSLINQIQDNNSSKSVINTPNLLLSLTSLTSFQIGIHISQEEDQLRFTVRSRSRLYLWLIQYYGDAQNQSELVNQGYGRVLSISVSTAGGVGEEQDKECSIRLNRIYQFFKDLNQGRNYRKPSFQPLPLLTRVSLEQIEEEGANEEIDTQMNTKGLS
ncbi:MAG: hypothetical protein EZS28_015039, partial [Streblomastix strix]